MSLGGAIQLPLLARAVAAVTFSHMLGDQQRGHHGVLGDCLDLTTIGLAQGADDVGAEGDAFLPYAEITKSGAHGWARWGGPGIERHQIHA